MDVIIEMDCQGLTVKKGLAATPQLVQSSPLAVDQPWQATVICTDSAGASQVLFDPDGADTLQRV